MDTIAGLPAEKFLNRRVRLINQHAGHRKPATLLEVHHNGKVSVKPDQHKDSEVIDIERVHPWWSQNPDLKQEHEDMVARQEAVEDLPEEDETQEECADIPPAKLPAMEIPEGIDFSRLTDGVKHLQDAMHEVQEVQRLMHPAQQREKEARQMLEKMGVKLKGGSS